jgi:hypothetical protein
MIYDCFPFFNELDLLEIRLSELAGVVDRFVVVESTRTQSNRPKPLYYHENRARYSPFSSKIVHIVVEDVPSGEDAWVRENHQRNCISRGLSGCSDDDTILVSDADEIPRASIVHPVDAMNGLELRLSYYFLNYVTKAPWTRSAILPYKLLRQMPNVQAVRDTRFRKAIKDAGWHFSHLGGVEKLQQKILACAHQELNKPEFREPAHIQRAIEQGRDLYNRKFQHFEVADLRSLPACVKQDPLRFRHLLWSEFHENWYSDEQCRALFNAYELARELIGDVVEVGCWEGRSTSVLANACYPVPLHAVDTWEGNADESPDHPTVALAKQRDVYRTFLKNMKSLTLGNVTPHVMRSLDFFAKRVKPIKFCHIDASHDYGSVKADIEAARKHLLPIGVLCGDDFLSASARRQDLQGGVERAVRELLPGFKTVGNFWYWQCPPDQSSSVQHAKNPLNLSRN